MAHELQDVSFEKPLDDDMKQILTKVANTIRHLAMDAVQKADSGHPGLPMGCAEIGAYLYGIAMRYNAKDPKWPNRDIFILSAGHGSMLLYGCLHLAGFKLSLEEIKNFRQLHSQTPGHPESLETDGVETTTGPLGQGVGNGIGMALAYKIMQETQYAEDTTRRISAEGRSIQHKMDLYLKERSLIPDLLWYSPLLRTKETALIIAEDFQITPQEEISLGEFLDEEELLQKLPPPKDNLIVFMVGHGPQLMLLAHYFTGYSTYPIPPSNSSALHLCFDTLIKPGSARVIRYYDPESDLPYGGKR